MFYLKKFRCEICLFNFLKKMHKKCTWWKSVWVIFFLTELQSDQPRAFFHLVGKKIFVRFLYQTVLLCQNDKVVGKYYHDMKTTKHY